MDRDLAPGPRGRQIASVPIRLTVADVLAAPRLPRDAPIGRVLTPLRTSLTPLERHFVEIDEATGAFVSIGLIGEASMPTALIARAADGTVLERLDHDIVFAGWNEDEDDDRGLRHDGPAR